MFFWRFKKKLKHNDIVTEIALDNVEENNSSGSSCTQEIDEKTMEMSKSLMIYIGAAIDKWAQEYDMEQLPRKKVFKKALVLMNLWEKTDSLK